MSNHITTKPSLSFPEVLRSREPKILFENRLIQLLTKRLKELKIIWSPQAFRGGLTNPKLPVRLITKLESLITLAEATDWKLSKVAKDELDTTIEDIETFNPSFRKFLKGATSDIKSGYFVTQKKLKQKHRLGN